MFASRHYRHFGRVFHFGRWKKPKEISLCFLFFLFVHLSFISVFLSVLSFCACLSLFSFYVSFLSLFLCLFPYCQSTSSFSFFILSTSVYLVHFLRLFLSFLCMSFFPCFHHRKEMKFKHPIDFVNPTPWKYCIRK